MTKAAVMTEAQRNELLNVMLANKESGELSDAVEALRGDESFAAASLIAYADDFAIQVRQRVRKIIHEHPVAYPTILSLLRTVLKWIDKDRELGRGSPDLDCLESFARAIGKDIMSQSWVTQ